MRTFLIGLVGLIALVVGGLLLAPIFISAEDLKPRIEKAATDALGREVTIGGIPDLRVFPNPVVSVDTLVVANAEGMSAENFASVSKADIGVKLMPLLGGNVEITRFVLTAPEINLQKRADGEVNWVLGSQDEAPVPEETDEPAGKSRIRDISLGTVQLIDGKVTYRDDASDQAFVAEDADITIGLASLDKPLTANGTMVFQGSPASLDATVSTPRSLMENTASMIDLAFSVEENAVDADINLAGGELNYDGNLSVDAPSLKALLGTLGMSLDAQTGFDKLTVSGAVSGTGERLGFSNADFTFDEIRGKGDVDFNWGGARPKISGQIDLSQMDLRPYLPAPSEAAKAAREDKSAGFPPWPEDQIDFSFLQAVDADLSARTNAIYLHGMAFGSSGLDLDINNGLLNATLTELDLYDGGGSGRLSVNSRERFPTVALRDLKLSGLNAQTFATEVLSLNRVRGVGGLEANLSARGTSVADFMRTLSGNGTIDVDEGAMEGVDIGKIVRSAAALLQGFENGSFNPNALVNAIAEARGPASETQFSNLDTVFTVNNGLLRSDNIVLAGPYYRINGEGTVSLPNQSMNLAFIPTVFETLEDVTGRRLNIPLQVSGTFNEPKVGFDTSSLVRGAVEGRLKGILGKNGVNLGDGETLEDGLRNRARDELGKALGLDGKPQPDPADPDARAEEPDLEDQLKNEALNLLFGGGGKEED